MRRWTLLLAPLALFACSLPGALGAPPTATPTRTPTATPTPTPTATPTPVPAVRMEGADQALFDGDWDLALQLYRQALGAGGDPALQAAARLGIAETLLRAGRFEQALAALDEYLAGYPDHERHGQAYFLRAVALEELGRDQEAVADYDRYLQARPGVIDSYVHERTGDALRRVGAPREAIERYRAAIAAPRLGSTLNLELKIARAYLEAGDYAAALEQLDNIYQWAGDAATKATVNLLAGRALQAMGDPQAAYERYLDSVMNFPQAYDSYTGLITLVEAGVPVDEFQRGLVDYNAGAYGPALQAFDRFIAATPTGTAYYFRGLTKRALGDYAGARADFAAVVQSFPDDPHWADAWLEQARTEWAYLDMYSAAVDTYLAFVAAAPASAAAPDALFAAGRTAERVGDLAQAAEIWLRLPAEYPGTALAYQGAFEAGVVRFRLGQYPAARDAFTLADGLAGDGGRRAAAQLWVGKTFAAQGEAEAARSAWQQAAELDPTGYYSERAKELLEGREPFQSRGLYDFSTDLEAERRQAEVWMRATFNIQAPGPLHELDARLAGDARMIRGEELWELGFFGEAKAEMESLRKSVEDDAEATYRLMHKLLEMRLYQPAIFAARRVMALAGMDDAGTMQAPVYFNHIRFAPYYGHLILPEAARYNLDGLFLLSVVRQESLFEGFATSYAAARGLMQVIPSTGEGIARALGWPPEYHQDDLYRPVVSVRFGTYYLAAQRDRFDGDLFAALAAYNAGPRNALIWKELAPDDPDLFLEVIRLTQPHRYIRTIYEVYNIYQRLYVSR